MPTAWLVFFPFYPALWCTVYNNSSLAMYASDLPKKSSKAKKHKSQCTSPYAISHLVLVFQGGCAPWLWENVNLLFSTHSQWIFFKINEIFRTQGKQNHLQKDGVLFRSNLIKTLLLLKSNLFLFNK